MSKPVIRVEELQSGQLLVHRRFGEVMVVDPPKKVSDLVMIQKIEHNNAVTHVRRQDLSWQ